MSRYWVGGATGFLGSHLVRHLVECGHQVTAVSRGGGEVSGVRVDRVDVLDAAAVEQSAKGCEGAFLCTGRVTRSPDAARELHQLHVLGTRSAMTGLTAAGVPRVVVASTSGTLAVSKKPKQHTELDPVPMELIASWPYYRTKYFGEREALDAVRDGFEVVIVNPTLLLGPGDTRESSTGDVRRFLDRSIPAAPAGGLSFVDVRDVAQAMLSAFEKGRSGERYLLSARNMTVMDFFERLSRLTGVPAPKLRLPKSPLAATLGHRLFTKAVEAIGGEAPVDETSVEMGQYFWYCDCSKAERELGFAPREAAETLRDTVDDVLAARRAFAEVSLGRLEAH